MNNFQALKDVKYPTVPHWYPNRSVRRAVKQGRSFRIPAVWQRFLAANPELVKTIKKFA